MHRSLSRALSIRQLRLVSILGRELNLSRCALALHTTQPATSRALAQLEANLNLQLFERTTKRITPTAAGLRLIHHANRILAEIELAEEDLHGLHGGISGDLRIGVLATFSAKLVAGAIERAGDMLPDVHFMTQTNDTPGLYGDLLDGRVDLMLCHAELTVDLNLVEVTAFYEEFSAVVAAPDHRLAHRRRPSWADIANEAWVLPPRTTPLRPKLDRLIAVHRSTRERARTDVQADSALVALGLVRQAGMLWAIANQHALEHEAAGLVRRVAMPGEILRGPMCSFRLRKEPLKAPARIFLQCLREVCAKIGHA